MRGHVLGLVLAMFSVCDGERYVLYSATESDQTQRGHDSDGHREYTMTGSMIVGGETTDLGCIECSSTWEHCVRDLNVRGGVLASDATDISIHVSFEAWENYKGSRCTYDTSAFLHDDGNYVSQSCIINPEDYTQDTYHDVTCTGSKAALKVTFMWNTARLSPAPPTPAPETHAPPTDSSSSVKVLAAVCAVVVVGAVVAGVMYKVRSQGGAADVPLRGAPLDEYAADEMDVSSEECMLVQ